MADDVRWFVAGDPISAERPTLGYQIRVLARRNRVAFAAGIAVLIALVTAVVGTTWGMLEAQRAEDDARVSAASELRERERAEGALDNAREATLLAQHERASADESRKAGRKRP